MPAKLEQATKADEIAQKDPSGYTDDKHEVSCPLLAKAPVEEKDGGIDAPKTVTGPEPGYLRGKKHGIKQQDADALLMAQDSGLPVGRWGSKSDLDAATKQAELLEPGGFMDFPVAAGSKSKVFMPDGSILDADMVRLRNNGNGKFHGFPINSTTAEPIRVPAKLK